MSEERVQFNSDSLKLAYYKAVCDKLHIAVPTGDNKQLVDLLESDKALFDVMAIGDSHDKFLKRFGELRDHVSKLTGTRSDSYESIIVELLGVNNKKDIKIGMILSGQKALARVGMEKISRLLREKIMTGDHVGYALESIDGVDYKIVTYNKK